MSGSVEGGPAVGRVAIVGGGQVGTMLGIALRRAGRAAGLPEVAVHDRDPAAAAASLERGAADRALASIDEALEADTVILAVPVPEVLRLVEEVGGRLKPRTLLLDTGSAKRVVVEAMRRSIAERAHALGGHPLAGTERPGAAGARPELLRGAPFVLTPVRDDPEALARGRALVAAVGARPVVMDAAAHDRAMARTSHVAHVAAFALASVGRPAGAVGALAPAPSSTGYLEATRLAGSDPMMVAGFLWANADEVGAVVGELIEALAGIASALGGSPEDLAARLRGAAVPQEATG